MKVSQASKIWLDYHRAHSKHNTIRAYKFTITKFNQNFANLNEGSKVQTKPTCVKIIIHFYLSLALYPASSAFNDALSIF